MLLPSQAYWEVLPEKSFQIQSDSLIIVLNSVKAEIISLCNADKVEVDTEDVYWADYYIKPGRTNILEFLLPGNRKWIKPKNINWVVIEWTDGKLIGAKE